MARPPLPLEELRVPVNIRFRREVLERLDAMAERDGVTRTAKVEELIEQAPMPRIKTKR
jgi:predicted DNA-binding protein